MRRLTTSSVKYDSLPADEGGVEKAEHSRTRDSDDTGFTLIELLIVIVILGILATVVVVSVRGISDRGEDATCEADARTLANAAESYFAKHGGTTIPPTGMGSEAVERTLANEGLVRQPSDLYDVDTDGAIVVIASRCTTTSV